MEQAVSSDLVKLHSHSTPLHLPFNGKRNPEMWCSLKLLCVLPLCTVPAEQERILTVAVASAIDFFLFRVDRNSYVHVALSLNSIWHMEPGAFSMGWQKGGPGVT